MVGTQKGWERHSDPGKRPWACPGLTMLQAEIERGSTYEGKWIQKNSLKKYQQDILMGFLRIKKRKPPPIPQEYPFLFIFHFWKNEGKYKTRVWVRMRSKGEDELKVQTSEFQIEWQKAGVSRWAVQVGGLYWTEFLNCFLSMQKMLTHPGVRAEPCCWGLQIYVFASQTFLQPKHIQGSVQSVTHLWYTAWGAVVWGSELRHCSLQETPWSKMICWWESLWVISHTHPLF